MRAAILHAHGAVPEVGEFDEPEGGEGADVLDVVAAGMNPIDIRIATGQFPLERYEPPYVAGKEGVGRRADGRLVYFEYARGRHGAFAERTEIDAGSGYVLPDGLEPALAVSLGVSGLAAWLGLQWRGGLAAGETVLVLGASGVVGQLAVQAAKLLGAGRVVAAARDEGGLERASRLGADAVVRLGGEAAAVTDALREAAEDGFDLVFDPLWGEPAQAALPALKSFGRLVNLGEAAGAAATLTSASVRAKPVAILGYTNYTAGEDRKAAAYAELAGHAAAGRIRIELERLGLDEAPDAWRRQPSSPHAKLVVEP